MRIRELDRAEVMTGSDFLCGMVAEDESGRVVMAMSAVVRAEVHMQMEPFSTPGARWALMQQMHREMERKVSASGIKRVWTFFDAPERFCKRLMHLFWFKSDSALYYRNVRS